MKLDTSVIGIDTSMRERAAALIALAIAKRGQELISALARRQNIGGSRATTPSSSGGK